MPNPHYALTAYNSSNPAPPQDKPKDQWLPYSAHGRTQPRKPSGGFGNFLLVANWDFKTCKDLSQSKRKPEDTPVSRLHHITHESKIPRNFNYTTSDHWVHHETAGIANLLHLVHVMGLCAICVLPFVLLLEIIINQSLAPEKISRTDTLKA